MQIETAWSWRDWALITLRGGLPLPGRNHKDQVMCQPSNPWSTPYCGAVLYYFRFMNENS
jgi:hypothetical protein